MLWMIFILAGNVSPGETANTSASAKTSDGSLPCLPAMALPLLAVGILTISRTTIHQ
jgi:hypothetical protein